MLRSTLTCLLLFVTGATLPLATAADPGARPATLRVMSYNIHHGEGIDQRLDLERIAKLITDAKADIVALQEVDRGVERSARRDLPAELAKLTGMTVHFDRNITHQGGEYGNAVLTKFPIKRAKNTHYRMLRPGEQRGLLQLVLNVHGRDVLFLNTHIDYQRDPSERLSNVEEMRGVVAAAGGMPVILCGDFNDVPGSQPHAKLKEFLVDTWEQIGVGPGFTIPVKKPTRRIDFIWISPGSIQPVSMEVLHSIASDHLPIVAELRLR